MSTQRKPILHVRSLAMVPQKSSNINTHFLHAATLQRLKEERDAGLSDRWKTNVKSVRPSKLISLGISSQVVPQNQGTVAG